MCNRIHISLIGLLSFLLIFGSGCVTLESQEGVSVVPAPELKQKGVYHKVKKGETLWRIAKTYGVPIEDITRINNIPKAAKIEQNQLVFIPQVDIVREIALDVDKDQNEFVWPVRGKVIRYFHQYYDGQLNKGIDIRVQEGDEVKAARTGRVVFADYLSGYGNTVILDHSDGMYSVYAKNSKLLVKLGELASRSTVIAQVGRGSELAYLHFQIRKNTREDNPLFYLP